MPGRVGDFVGLDDDAVGIDQVADPLRIVGELVVGFTEYLVLGADRLVGVGEQQVGKVLGFGELPILLRSVERDPQDDTVGFGKRLGLITQALSFKRSTRGSGFRIPPQEHVLAAVRRQCYGIALVVVGGEIRGFGFGFKHLASQVARLVTMECRWCGVTHMRCSADPGTMEICPMSM